MKILEVKLINAFGIRQFDFKPDGQSVKVLGRNGAGKSSLLLGIEAAIRGTTLKGRDDLRDITYARFGESDAPSEVLVKLGDANLGTELEVYRKWDEDSKAEKFYARINGVVQDAPKRLLESMLRALTFNPIAFYKADDRTQRDMVMKAMPVHFANATDFAALLAAALKQANKLRNDEYDYTVIDAIRDELQPDFETEHALDITARFLKSADKIREDSGAQVKTQRDALLAAGGNDQPPVYAAEQHAEGEQIREDFGAAFATFSDNTRAHERATDAAAAAQRRVDELRKQLLAAEDELTTRTAAVTATLEDVNYARANLFAEAERACAWAGVTFDESVVDENRTPRILQDKLSEFEVQRRRVDDYHEAQQRMARIRSTIEAASRRYDLATDAVTLFRDGVPKLLTDRAQLPIPGLTFSDEGIFVNGVSIKKRSSGERMMFAIQLAEAQLRDEQTDKIETMLIDDFEHLDPEAAETLETWASTSEVQLIVTRVARGDLRWEPLA